MIFDVIDIEDKLGVTFKNKALLKTAFTHSSFANEKKIVSNENLEFLGDSILNFVTADYLYHKYSNKDEGELSQMRATIVSAAPLYSAIEMMKLGEHMYLGVGETKSSGNRENIYADLFEAIVAAIYLDADLSAAKKFILTSLSEHLNQKVTLKAEADFKTRLQEYAQHTKGNKLKYDLLEKKGPDHSPEFIFAVLLNDREIGRGSGKSKRDAQQAAAENALVKLKI